MQEALHFEAVRATVRNGSVVCAMLLGQMLPRFPTQTASVRRFFRPSGVSLHRLQGANAPRGQSLQQWTCLGDLGLLSKNSLVHLPGEYRAQVRWACHESKMHKVFGRQACAKHLESVVRGHLPICELAGRMQAS